MKSQFEEPQSPSSQNEYNKYCFEQPHHQKTYSYLEDESPDKDDFERESTTKGLELEDGFISSYNEMN